MFRKYEKQSVYFGVQTQTLVFKVYVAAGFTFELLLEILY